jgi:hypothetical protein
MVKGIAVAIFALAFAARAAADDFDVIARTTCASIYAPRTVLIRTDAELTSAWLDLGLACPPPGVDFRRNSVVVYCAGARPTSGYQLWASGSSVEDRVLHLVLTEAMPGVECCTWDKATFPAIAVLVPARHRKVQVDLDTSTTICPD